LANVHLSWPDTEDKNSTGVDIGHDVRRERAMREQRERGWELTKQDLDRIGKPPPNGAFSNSLISLSVM
jgi:hypothetical protein